MAAQKWQLYTQFFTALKDGTLTINDLPSTDIYIALFASGTNCATLTLSGLAAVTGEVSGNGYSAGGIAIANGALATSGQTTTFLADDVSFIASGGTIASQYAVAYAKTADILIAYSAHELVGSTPQTISTPDQDILRRKISTAFLSFLVDNS